MSFYFSDQSWVKLKSFIERDALVILPVGQTEEHGKHLPVGTDAFIGTRLAEALAEKLQADLPALIMPTIWAGYSAREMVRWPGTIVVRPRVLMDYVFDICSSLVEMGFKRVMLLCCHGPHGEILRIVAREIADKYDVYLAVAFPHKIASEQYRKIARSDPKGNVHGDERETSMMLYFGQPVEMDQATPEDFMSYRSEFRDSGAVFWSTWGVQKSNTGIYGDPTVASSETGKLYFEAMVDGTAGFAREFCAHRRK
jgi:creatinine amidohydrolase